MAKLYHYVHCPFCVRVRLGAGRLQVPYESVVLPYDDEKTPLSLTGVKMLPIWEDQGKAQNESLDILRALDQGNVFQWELIDNDPELLNEVEDVLQKLGSPIHNLCMPYWVWTPEFDTKSRAYFVQKKAAKRGPFHQLMKNADQFLRQLEPELLQLEQKLTPFYGGSDQLTIIDIMMASHLWGLMIYPEFHFSPRLLEYLMTIKRECHFDYHQDFKNEHIFGLGHG